VNRGALDFVCAFREHFLSTDQERVMDSRRNWRSASRCRTSDAEDLFVTGRKQREARSFCRVCPVRTECLAHALDQRVEFGVWGGMTERERRALLRRRPDVRSWAELLADARAAHDATLLDMAEPQLHQTA
jgi:WhiB family redox-sensing transcriptional regulator